MNKPAFIWDLDGTLLDSYPIIVLSLYETYREFGIELDQNEIHKELITWSLGVYLSKMQKETGIDSEAIRKRFAEINNSRAMDIKPVRNAAAILSYLQEKGIPNYVFTHKGVTTEAVLKNLNLYDYFGDIITGTDGFPKKPDPAAINYLVEKHGLDKQSTFYVGDRTLDIACAVNAGIKSIFYLPPESVAESNGKETYIVRDLLDIREIAEREIAALGAE